MFTGSTVAATNIAIKTSMKISSGDIGHSLVGSLEASA
jgi:hypothetical protein